MVGSTQTALCAHVSSAGVKCDLDPCFDDRLQGECASPPYQKDPEVFNKRLPGVMRRVEEFEFQFNRNMYNVALHRGKNCFPIGRMSREKMTTTGCGHRPASAAHVVLYTAPVVIEWSSYHDQGRLVVGHWQRHVPRRGACWLN